MICADVQTSSAANKSAKASFSPLAYLETNFEENIVEHYSKTLDPESLNYVFSQLPEVVGNSGSIPSVLPHFDFIRQRFASISRIETVEKLFDLTTVWMGKIHFLLTWAIFLRFNPLYEYYQLPPLPIVRYASITVCCKLRLSSIQILNRVHDKSNGNACRNTQEVHNAHSRSFH